METFTAMADRLQEEWGCDRKMAVLATRYYRGTDSFDDLRARAARRPVRSERGQRPELTDSQVTEIIRSPR